MLQVQTNHQIVLLHFREGLSSRKIAKKLKINFLAVAGLIREFEEFKVSPIIDQDKPQSLLNHYVKTGSSYNTSTRTAVNLTPFSHFVKLAFDKAIEVEIEK